MCGIVGLVYKCHQSVSIADIDKMNDKIRHRGPDGAGVFISSDQRVGLGHRRLAIIDVVASSDQPMTEQTGRLTIVFNGEIYNYQELRAALSEQGFQFRTHSDTEVILVAYKHWGRDCVRHLRGMFAFAIWDDETKSIFLARDRIGIKPIYFLIDDHRLAFASELSALEVLNHSRPEISLQAFDTFLKYKSVVGTHTIWEGIEKLEPGTCLSLSLRDGKSEVHRYWSLEELGRGSNGATSKSEMLDRLSETLEMHLVSDVPVGLLLSGGVDSNFIAARLNEKNGISGMPAFTIDFDSDKNESELASYTAEGLGLKHHIANVSRSGLEEGLVKMAKIYHDPLADSSCVPTIALCQEVAKHVKVAIGGDGGDEAFMGYKWQLAYWHMRCIPGFPLPQLQSNNRLSMLLGALSRSQGDRWEYLHGFVFSQAEIAELTGRPYHGFEIPWNAKNEVSRELRIRELSSFTLSSILYKVDHASMANGLEVRVPFLDHKVIEDALNLQISEMISGLSGKRLLRNYMRDHLPLRVSNAPKTGFGLPLGQWSSEIQKLANEKLLDGLAVQLNLLSYENLKLLVQGKSWRKETKLWVLLCFEYWLRHREQLF